MNRIKDGSSLQLCKRFCLSLALPSFARPDSAVLDEVNRVCIFLCFILYEYYSLGFR